MIFILGGVVYGQSDGGDSEKVFNNFLLLGEQRKLNEAMTLVANQANIYKNNPEIAELEGDNHKNLISDKYYQIAIDLWHIYSDKIKIVEITNDKISNNLEIFRLTGIDRNKEIRKAKAILIKEENMWKIFSFAWESKLELPPFTFRKIL
jgi:hypothetical protein